MCWWDCARAICFFFVCSIIAHWSDYWLTGTRQLRFQASTQWVGLCASCELKSAGFIWPMGLHYLLLRCVNENFSLVMAGKPASIIYQIQNKKVMCLLGLHEGNVLFNLNFPLFRKVLISDSSSCAHYRARLQSWHHFSPGAQNFRARECSYL